MQQPDHDNRVNVVIEMNIYNDQYKRDADERVMPRIREVFQDIETA